MRKARILAFCLLLAPGSAAAADEGGRYTAIGAAGVVSCEAWLLPANESNGVKDQLRNWLAGYLTAYNRHAYPGRNIAAGYPPDRLLSWADRFCQNNLSATMAVLADSLILELERNRK